MARINHGWYVGNEGICYPLDETATSTSDQGTLLPSDVLADLFIKYPETYGRYAFLASIGVTAQLVSITIQASDDPDTPSTFQPLVVLSVRQPVGVHQNIALLAQAPGVGGWVVFGQGARDRATYRGRFSSPRQGLLTQRAARPYRPLPITGVKDIRVAQLLQGVVRLRGEPPLEIVKEEREINGVRRDVVVFRLNENIKGETFKLPSEAALLLPSTQESVFQQFAGQCASRPESQNCGTPDPIEFINTVGPDCDGMITLEFRGCAQASKIAEACGVVIDCAKGLADSCTPAQIPNQDGLLPSEVDPVNIPPVPPVPPDPTPDDPDESIVMVGELPYTECFDRLNADGFDTKTGIWEFNTEDTEDQNSYCPVLYTNSLSTDVASGSYEATDVGVDNVTVWQGFDESTLGRKFVTAAKMLQGPVGAKRNVGVVINYRPHTTALGQYVYHLAQLDYDAQTFNFKRFNGVSYQTVFSITLPGLKLNRWYRLTVETTPGPTNGKVSILVRVVEIGGALTATLGPFVVGNYYPSSGYFGFHTGKALARFSYFRLEMFDG